MPPPYGRCYRTIEVLENGMEARGGGVVYSALPLTGEAEFEVELVALSTRWSVRAQVWNSSRSTMKQPSILFIEC